MQSFLLSLALLAGAPAALAQQEVLPVFPDLEMAGAEGGSQSGDQVGGVLGGGGRTGRAVGFRCGAGHGFLGRLWVRQPGGATG